MKAIRLKVENLKNPLGIDIRTPRLTWNCEGGQKQSAYEVVCKNEQGELLWDSGKVSSDAMHAQYAGRPLKDRERVRWSLQLWDETDTDGAPAEGIFELGISRWEARWITGNYRVNKNKRYPVDCFRKVFSAHSGVQKARLYITACGLYEANLNGQRCGDFIFAPGYTDYRRRVQYQTYDVTDLLKFGENILTIQLADGWYRGSCGGWGLKNQYGTETKVLAQLEITYTDGSVQTIVTDESWDWSQDGPIRFADNKDGEIVDANPIPTYSKKAKLTRHRVIPTASNNVPVKEHEHFSPTLLTTLSGQKVLDFGQNIAGYIAFDLQGKKGQQLTLLFGEMLDGKGEFTQENFQLGKGEKRTPLQRIVYACKEGRNQYKTSFAIFGFRYVLVEGNMDIDPAAFTAIAVYSDMEQTGFFDSSHPLLNQFVEATIWSAKGNHLDIPTDCPTRERHGWTGDAQIFFNTAAYLFDFAPFSKKFLRDIYDWQKGSGRLPQIAPEGGVDFYMGVMNGSVGWSDIGILYPWRYVQMYGDDSILKEFYPGMASYARFMIGRCGKTMPLFGKRIRLSRESRKYLVNIGQSYGEWSEPVDVWAYDWTDFCAPHTEVSTAYTAYVLNIMAEVAEKFGTAKDVALFREYADGCRRAYEELVETPEYSLDTDRQAALVRPLYMGLLTKEQEAFAKERLLLALEHYGWRLGTGFLSTPLILEVLENIDLEATYRLLENEEIPGWLSMPRLGATTVWESWEGPYNTQGAGAGSLNHYSKGAVCEWLFKSMCGIRISKENQFTIAPKPGGSLTYAKATYDSVYGRVESRWEKTAAGYRYTITIPANCTADVLLPNDIRYTQTAGEATYGE